MKKAEQTVCLCMIVKNEEHVIRRCLQSVLPFIDSWVIVDTGSTDGTQDCIRKFLHDVPGELFERPWVNFAHNRSESLALAHGRADYLFVIDADEVLEPSPGFLFPSLTGDAYDFEMRSGPLAYYKTQLVREALRWRYEGVVHEYIVSDLARQQERMPGIRTLRIPDGARSRDPLTYRRDALLLEEALLAEPANARHMYYLGQSYSDAQEPALAMDRFARRVAMGGWAEEVWCSLYQIARLKHATGKDWPEVLTAYLAAFSFRADRAEPLFRIGIYYQLRGEYTLAHLFFSRAMQVPYPEQDILFVEREIYEYLLPLEYAVSCFYVERHREAIQTANDLLTSGRLSREQEEKVMANRRFSLDALYARPVQFSGQKTLTTPKSTRIVVSVLFDGDESSLQPCVEALLSQKATCKAVFVDRCPGGSEALEAALQGTPFKHEKVPRNRGWTACLQAVAEEADADDVLLLLEPGSWLAGPQSLQTVISQFEQNDCMLLYGQFRWSDGRLGNAIPVTSPEALYTEASMNLNVFPVAFRKALLEEIGLPDDSAPIDLLRAAGFARMRFNDLPIAVCAVESARVVL